MFQTLSPSVLREEVKPTQYGDRTGILEKNIYIYFFIIEGVGAI